MGWYGVGVAIVEVGGLGWWVGLVGLGDGGR